ncbi:S-adenosyl-L-methionine-dependent methyltransferase [Pilobolus umbonatus]|nr:S-adenosyl-L-methionine-dependent methyltransferase [Pilobolus umbonatus]
MSDHTDPIPEAADLSLKENTTENDHKVIDGRRYHNEEEALQLAFNGNFKAPLKEQLEEGIVVVDSGCGPAARVFDMAKDFPNSNFTGLDISFVDSDTIKPDSVEFKACNITNDIPFEDNSVDYFHQRLLVAGLTKTNYQNALKEAFRVTKPGGYIELGEPHIGAYENSGPYMTSMQGRLGAMVASRGMVPDLVDHLTEYLEEAGFVNIVLDKRYIPINHSGKIGELWWRDCSEGIRSFKPVLAMSTSSFNNPEVFEAFMTTLSDECVEYKAQIAFGIAYAQKPLEED